MYNLPHSLSITLDRPAHKRQHGWDVQPIDAHALQRFSSPFPLPKGTTIIVLSAPTAFYATEHVELANIPPVEPVPQPTQLEIDAFVVLLAQISHRLLTDASATSAA